MIHHRPSSAEVAARKAEIAARYRRKAAKSTGRKPRTLAAIRLAELTRLFDARWGRILLPETDDGLVAARIMCHHIGALPDATRRISAWLQACTPWLPMRERERLISEVTECRLRWSADKLAWKLKVTDAERTRLKITTIGAVDVSAEQRAERRAARKRERERARRATKPADHASAPWIALGISRATFYRRRRHAPKP